jgi:hypothetical protein
MDGVDNSHRIEIIDGKDVAQKCCDPKKEGCVGQNKSVYGYDNIMIEEFTEEDGPFLVDRNRNCTPLKHILEILKDYKGFRDMDRSSGVLPVFYCETREEINKFIELDADIKEAVNAFLTKEEQISFKHARFNTFPKLLFIGKILIGATKDTSEFIENHILKNDRELIDIYHQTLEYKSITGIIKIRDADGTYVKKSELDLMDERLILTFNIPTESVKLQKHYNPEISDEDIELNTLRCTELFEKTMDRYYADEKPFFTMGWDELIVVKGFVQLLRDFINLDEEFQQIRQIPLLTELEANFNLMSCVKGIGRYIINLLQNVNVLGKIYFDMVGDFVKNVDTHPWKVIRRASAEDSQDLQYHIVARIDLRADKGGSKKNISKSKKEMQGKRSSRRLLIVSKPTLRRSRTFGGKKKSYTRNRKISKSF